MLIRSQSAFSLQQQFKPRSEPFIFSPELAAEDMKNAAGCTHVIKLLAESLPCSFTKKFNNDKWSGISKGLFVNRI